MDVIKRDYVAEIIEKLSSSGQFTPENMMMSVNALPDALVRCKDCKYLRRRRKNEHYVFCGNPVNGLWRIWSGDSFCSYGERKDDG